MASDSTGARRRGDVLGRGSRRLKIDGLEFSRRQAAQRHAGRGWRTQMAETDQIRLAIGGGKVCSEGRCQGEAGAVLLDDQW